MPKPVEVSPEEVEVAAAEVVVTEAAEVVVVEGEQPDANALLVAANQQAMAVLADKGMLTDSHLTNLSLRN